MRFQKGHIPWNKGTKGLMKPNSGNFKGGQIPHNKIEIEKELLQDIYWGEGLSLGDIADILDISRSTIHNKMKEFDIPRRTNSEARKGCIPWNKGIPCTEEVKKKLSGLHKGKHYSLDTEFKKGIPKEDNHNWKGVENVGYRRLHEILREDNPPPKDGKCTVCGEEKELELANLSGYYIPCIEDFKYMCASCHNKFDKCISN